MLWPIILPFQVTCVVFVGAVALLTGLAPALKWKRRRTVVFASLLACVAFIPSCVGIMTVIDSQRFGTFHYDSFADVNDFRVERYLPTKARNIILHKYAPGHRAKYSISETDLTAYVDHLWEICGKYSAYKREELNDRTDATPEMFELEYGDLDSPPLESTIVLHSPVESDGGGATYFYDRITGTAYQCAGYW